MEDLKKIKAGSRRANAAYDSQADPAYLFKLLNEMGEIIFSFDIKNKKVFTNNAALDTFNIQPSVFGLNSDEWLKHVHPKDIEVIKNGNRKVLLGEEVSDEFRALLPDNKHVWMSRHMKPIFNKKKDLERLHVIMININQHKENAAVLEGRVDELTQVIYRMAHDLRAPLMSMLGLVNLSKYEVKDPTASKFMDLISDSAKKMDNILLSLSSMVTAMGENQKIKPVDFKEMIRDILKSVEHISQMKGLNVSVNVKQKKEFLSDPGLLHSILYNIIINAVKFRRGTHDAFVNITVEAWKGHVAIEVEDNGAGIRREALDNIFKMFYKDNDQPSSSGLGLYIVKSCLDKLNGTIEVDSEPGRGTRFSIIIPQIKPVSNEQA